MSIGDDLAKWQEDLSKWLEAKLLELSPFLVDVEERDRQEMRRLLVWREEQAHVWALPVKDVAFIAEQFVNGLPVSGDDRPDVRLGGWR